MRITQSLMLLAILGMLAACSGGLPLSLRGDSTVISVTPGIVDNEG